MLEKPFEKMFLQQKFNSGDISNILGRYIIVFVKRSSSTNIVQKSDLSQFLETTLSIVQLYKSEVYVKVAHLLRLIPSINPSLQPHFLAYIKSLPKKNPYRFRMFPARRAFTSLLLVITQVCQFKCNRSSSAFEQCRPVAADSFQIFVEFRKLCGENFFESIFQIALVNSSLEKFFASKTSYTYNANMDTR